MVIIFFQCSNHTLVSHRSVLDFKSPAMSRRDINVSIYDLAITSRRKKQTSFQCMDFLLRERVLIFFFDSIDIRTVGVDCVSVFFA